MKRVLLLLLTLFSIGILFGIYTRLDLIYINALVFILIGISSIMYLRGRKVFCLIYLIIFLCGVIAPQNRINKIKSPVEDILGKNIEITGQISGDVKHTKGYSSYTLLVDKVEVYGNVYNRPFKIKIIDYKNKKDYIIPFNSVKIGGRIENSNQYINTGLIDYERYLLIRGISGTMAADLDFNIKSYKDSKRPIPHKIYNSKINIEKILSKYTYGKTYEMLKGVTLGDVSNMDREDYKAFQDIGIVHIFAVSGYNIWLIYSILQIIFSFLKVKAKIKFIIIICILGIYTILVGGSPSIVRAFVMMLLIVLGKVLKREADPLTSLSLAGIIILMANPLRILDIGFQLSFICVLAIILIYPKMNIYFNKINIHLPKKIRDSIILNISIQVGILPLLLYYFNSFSILSILSNLVIVPMVSLFTVIGMAIPILAFTFEGGAFLLGEIANYIGNIILKITYFIDGIPYSNLNVVSPSILGIIVYYIYLALILNIVAIKNKQQKILKAALAAVLVLVTIYPMFNSELNIYFINVGQGDSILISTPDNKYILMDGGGKPKNSFSTMDIGEQIVKPYLLTHGVNNLNMIISTHAHEDHLNGILSVMKTFNTDLLIKTVYGNYGDSFDDLIDNKKILNVKNGDLIEVGKYVKLYILNPLDDTNDENDSSIVIKLVFKDFTALFTGDISSEVEKKLLNLDIDSDIIKVPHHGSSTSLDMDFLSKVSPEAAIICVGENNFGHPMDSVIKRINQKGIKIYRTDLNGDIIIKTKGKGFKVKTSM